MRLARSANLMHLLIYDWVDATFRRIALLDNSLCESGQDKKPRLESTIAEIRG